MPEAAAKPPPAFTVVMPVHNVADYLGECLDSVLGQSFTDVEVVAVDDASTDDGPALLDERAGRDPRLQVEHLSHNVGLGMARNTGLERAQGRWVLFLDSDDTLADGALAAIAERVAGAPAADVVLFGFARSFPDGSVVPDPRSARLSPEVEVAATQRPDLLEILPSAWNKAYRRDFLADRGFAFPTGYYEDIPWTYPVLWTARSIATLDRTCYLYRQRTGGSILSSSGRRHLDLFAQYGRAFDYLDAHAELEPWRPWLVDRMTRHVPTVLEADGRIPADVREEFFHAASAAFRSHRPPGYLPRGMAGVKVRLIERDDYRAFRAAQLANRLARRLRPGQRP